MTAAKGRELADFLADDYCLRCNSFGHVEDKAPAGLWCNVCWDWSQRLPLRLRQAIEEAVNRV